MTDATELTRDEVNQLREGDTARIVTPRGVVHQGPITSFGARYGGKISSLWVNGKMFGIPQHEIYRPKESAVVIDPPKESADPAEVRDIIADMCAPGTTEGAKPKAVGVRDIAHKLLGFSADLYGSGSDFGGKSPEGWIGQFMSVGSIKRALSDLTAEGELVQVKASSRFSKVADDERYISFSGGRTGWVTKAALEESKAQHAEKLVAADHAKLVACARNIVADRHPDEVDQVVAMLEKAGK